MKNQNKTKGWPPERRATQAARIRAHRPWTKSTGPRTPQGKARSSQNATKHGFHNRDWRALRAALTLYHKFLKTAQTFLAKSKQNFYPAPKQKRREFVQELKTFSKSKQNFCPDKAAEARCAERTHQYVSTPRLKDNAVRVKIMERPSLTAQCKTHPSRQAQPDGTARSANLRPR